MWFFLGYWLLSIFIYLYKKAQYTTYTRIIQRFWKRALYLFWIIEFYLFFIFLFLTLITPQEVMYLLDNIWQYFSFTNKLKPFFINILNILFIILLFNVVLVSRKYKTNSHTMNLIILLLVLFILQDDFTQFYSINQYYNNFNWKYTLDGKFWELEVATIKRRTYTHYIYLLILLKFWHTAFICLFFVFFENIAVKTNKNSYNILSAQLQNLYFLLFFSFVLKIIYLKHYMNYLYEYVYFWFFINRDFLTSLDMQIVIKVYSFIYYDFFKFLVL